MIEDQKVFWREPDRIGNKFSDIYKIAAVTLTVMPRAWRLRDSVALGYCFKNAMFPVKTMVLQGGNWFGSIIAA